MSSTLPLLLKRLLSALRDSASPAFRVAELINLSPEGTRALLRMKILRRTAPSSSWEHPTWGHVEVVRIGGRPFLSLPDSPAAAPRAVDEQELEQVQLDQAAFARWIADDNELDDARDLSGNLWTLGHGTMHGLPATVLYVPSPFAVSAFGDLISIADAMPEGRLTVVLAPTLAQMTRDEIRSLHRRRVIPESLHSLLSAGRVDLQKVSPPAQAGGVTTANVFRRTGTGWEIRFQGGDIHAVADLSGMDEIWFLLRNPGKDFEVSEIANQLAALDDEDVPVRSRGTKTKSTRDLPADVRRELAELILEKEAAEESEGKDAVARIDEEIAGLLGRHGIKDSFGGLVKREGDDLNAEVERVYKATGRALGAILKTGDLRGLGDHLKRCMSRRPPLSFRPDQPQVWQT
jgi:hypothetical protein